MNMCLRQDFGRDSRLAPGGVVDAFPLAILSGHIDKSSLERGKVVLTVVAAVREALLDVPALLDQVDALEGIGFVDAIPQAVEPLLQRLEAHLPPAPRLVLLQCYEVATHRMALATSCRKRVLVLGCEGRLCSSLTWGHRDSFAESRRLCKTGTKEATST